MNDGGIFDEPDEGSHDADLPPVEPTIATPIDKSKKHLVCVADNTGNPLVAKAAYDQSGEMQLLEAYRRPTQQEWNHLAKTGQIIKQGATQQPVKKLGETGSTGWSTPAKIAAAVLGLGAVVGGGFFIAKKVRNKNPAEDNEIEPDEPEDDDDDDDGDDDED